jgi:hypothetical protein
MRVGIAPDLLAIPARSNTKVQWTCFLKCRIV